MYKWQSQELDPDSLIPRKLSLAIAYAELEEKLLFYMNYIYNLKSKFIFFMLIIANFGGYFIHIYF